MIPKNQNKRLLQIAFFGALLLLGGWMVFSALSKTAQFFYNPSEIFAEGFEPKSATIKVGGLVVPGTLKKDDGITAIFEVIDFPEDGKFEGVNMPTLKVSYDGVLPDLFAEGEGVVVSGLLIDEDSLVADEVLAKHDENYQPQKD